MAQHVNGTRRSCRGCQHPRRVMAGRVRATSWVAALSALAAGCAAPNTINHSVATSVAPSTEAPSPTIDESASARVSSVPRSPVVTPPTVKPSTHLASPSSSVRSAFSPQAAPTTPLPVSPSPDVHPAASSQAPPRVRLVDLPTGGTSDAVFPPGDDPYTLLSDGSCNDLLTMVATWPKQGVPGTDVSLYRAAGEACLRQWDASKTDQAAFDAAGGAPTECSKKLVVAWVRALLIAHDADPTAVLTYAKHPGIGACPTALPTSLNTDPIGPSGIDAYKDISDGDGANCSTLRDILGGPPPPPGSGISNVDYYLYHAAALTCLSDWAGAQTDFDHLRSMSPAPALSCPKQVVSSWIGSTLMNKAASPSVTTVTFVSRQVKPQC